tara:strand:+ start:144 stop:1361 length:1218 start_codon:yes stop_codon:yes gene_type:complete
MWYPKRETGLKQLERFAARSGKNYTANRNFDLGMDKHEHVSKLSPWVRHRIISEEEVVTAVLKKHSLNGAEKFVQEVFWRSYWKGWLETHPSVWTGYKVRTSKLAEEMEINTSLREQYLTATTGKTGIACFDDWTQELIESGYLHNHARMWFASIWVFTLKLPWELGADFFLRYLLDGDPASNTLSWRWVAGLHTKGKTYLARSDNISKFTKGRYTNITQLSSEALPAESGAETDPLIPLPMHVPFKNGVPTGLLLTDEDLNPVHIIKEIGSIAAVASFSGVGQRSLFPVSSNVSDFVCGAHKDAGMRLKQMKCLNKSPVAGCKSVEEICEWALRNDLYQVVTPHISVGPTRDALKGLSKDLVLNGIKFHQVMTHWDLMVWPHSSRGFFKLRKKIPKILSELHLI